jgi:site-specific DNA-methyltransferase (adenine-specific)
VSLRDYLFHEEPGVTLYLGECEEIMRAMDADSIDAIVTDPPYLIGFMGKEFDSQHRTFVERKSARRAESFESVQGNHNPTDPQDSVRTRRTENQKGQAWHEAWAREALRVLKPGAHLLAFGGTRTYHRLTCALEDAGFEIRDCLMWLYGSGFPKSLDVSKAIDKAAGAERAVIGPAPGGCPGGTLCTHGGNAILGSTVHAPAAAPATAPATAWSGWGTALKPAYEPIVLARKPLSERNVAANVLRLGTGALNIDGCRIGTSKDVPASPSRHADVRTHGKYGPEDGTTGGFDAHLGRWPANVMLSHAEGCERVGTKTVKADGHYPSARPQGQTWAGHHGQDGLDERALSAEVVEAWACVDGCPVRLLDEQSGELTSGKPAGIKSGGQGNAFDYFGGGIPVTGIGDTGGASRFFYTAKADKTDRDGSKHPVMETGIAWREALADQGDAADRGDLTREIEEIQEWAFERHIGALDALAALDQGAKREGK